MSKLKFNITRSSGFTLIELLVVVAILGILSAIGTISYSGYVTGAKMKSAENILQQVSLAQLEYFTNTGEYYPGGTATSCDTSDTSHENLGNALFDDSSYIASDDMEYNFCAYSSITSFTIVAESRNSDCKLTLSKNGSITKENC